MSLFHRFFLTAGERRDVEQARNMIQRALQEARKPKGCGQSAATGADTRRRLLTLVGDVEKEIGQLAIVFAADGTLTHPRLIEALYRRRDDGELLKLSISSCFMNPQATQYVNQAWPVTVKQYQHRQNNEELINEKAAALAAFVVHNLNTTVEACKQLTATGFDGIQQELTPEQLILVRLEEAACWYRVIDELAYGFISEYRARFVDYLLDTLAHQLALQGVPPDLICRTMAERSEEYSRYREWVSSDANRMAGTLLWNAGKHAGLPVGLDRHFTFIIIFGTLFLERVKRALVYKLLTGKEKHPT